MSAQVTDVFVISRGGVWFWEFFVNGRRYQCSDRGLPLEELARREGEDEKRRVLATIQPSE